MSTLARIEEGDLTVLETRSRELSREQVDLIKQTICKGASDTELALFVAQCNRTGLDPFSRQIHAVKRWDAREKREVMSIQVGVDGFRLIADRTGRYIPGREPELRYDAQGGLVSATAYIKKLVAGEWHEIAASAHYEEYVQTNRDGDPNAMWKRMPRTMLAKCAECLALRKAFPAEMSGLYSPEEMGEPAVVQTPAGPVSRATGEILPPERPALPAAAVPRCDECPREITAAQATLSQKNHGRPLCPEHNRAANVGQREQALPPPAAESEDGRRGRCEAKMLQCLEILDREDYTLSEMALDTESAFGAWMLGIMDGGERWVDVRMDEMTTDEIVARGRDLWGAIQAAKAARAAKAEQPGFEDVFADQ